MNNQWITRALLWCALAAASANAQITINGSTTRPAVRAPVTRPVPTSGEQYKPGEKVELKEGRSWSKGTIKNRDGNLYLVVFDGWENKFHWQWVHVSMVRPIGGTKDTDEFVTGVHIANSSVYQAKAEAKTKFASFDARMGASAADAPTIPNPARAEVANDSTLPLSQADLAVIPDHPINGGPAHLATPDAIDPKAPRFSSKPIELRASNVEHPQVRSYCLSGPFLMVATTEIPTSPYKTWFEKINLSTGASVKTLSVDRSVLPIALSPSGNLMLTRLNGWSVGMKDRIDVYDLSGAGEPKLVVRFRPFGARNFVDVASAVFIDETHLLTSNGPELVVWKIMPNKVDPLYRLNMRWGEDFALSANRKQLAIGVDHALAILDTITGEPLAYLPGDAYSATFAFSPDGRQVVSVGDRVLTQWDLTGGAPPITTAIGKLQWGRKVEFVSNRQVLLNQTYLFDLDKKCIVWRYEGVRESVGASGGRYWAVVTSPPPQQRRFLVSAELPDDAAKTAIAALNPADQMLLQPGKSISLELNIAADEEQKKRITDAIVVQFKANNISVAPGQPIKLVARTEDGKSEPRRYQNLMTGQSENVNVTQKVTRLTLESNGQTLWETSSATSASVMVSVKDKQSVADAVARQSKYDVSFFERVGIPVYVAKPSDTPGTGASAWSMAGVEPKPAKK